MVSDLNAQLWRLFNQLPQPPPPPVAPPPPLTAVEPLHWGGHAAYPSQVGLSHASAHFPGAGLLSESAIDPVPPFLVPLPLEGSPFSQPQTVQYRLFNNSQAESTHRGPKGASRSCCDCLRAAADVASAPAVYFSWPPPVAPTALPRCISFFACLDVCAGIGVGGGGLWTLRACRAGGR